MIDQVQLAKAASFHSFYIPNVHQRSQLGAHSNSPSTEAGQRVKDGSLRARAFVGF